MQVPYRKPGKFSSLKPDPLLTEAKLTELTHQLARLKEVSRPAAASEVKRLAELGDFSENAEYQLAKGRLRGINSRIISLESQINHAHIIPTATSNDVVQIGHTVTVRRDGKDLRYRILGSSETKPGAGVISHTSPVGAALLGRGVGEVVEVCLADKTVNYEIIAIG